VLARLPREVVELKACGPEDPDGSKTAAVLGAYFEAEHARAFRRLLWLRLAVAAIVWVLIGTTTSLIGLSAVFAGLTVIGAAAVFAAIVEWRAERRLSALNERLRS
jgi:Flp pilus assembly protein TadB